MTTKRMVQLRNHPLTHVELINALSFKDPVYCEEEDAFLGLYNINDKISDNREKSRKSISQIYAILGYYIV